MKKILVIGEILVEIMADEIGQSFLQSGSFHGPFASGAPAIFIDQAAKFGVPAAILSAVGDDDFGRLCLKKLRDDGVDIRSVRIVKDTATGVAFVRYNSDGSRNFIYHINNAACGSIQRDDLDRLDWDAIGAFHIMGSSIFNKEMYTIHREALKRLQEGCVLSFDPNVRPEILSKDPDLSRLMQEFFSLSGVLFVTEDELEFLTEKGSLQDSLAICFEKGIRIVVVKRGEKGASLYTNHSRFDADPITTEEVDPTGAGDTFAGAFMAGYLQGWPLEQCLTHANAAGASAVSRQGPMGGTLFLDDVKHII